MDNLRVLHSLNTQILLMRLKHLLHQMESICLEELLSLNIQVRSQALMLKDRDQADRLVYQTLYSVVTLVSTLKSRLFGISSVRLARFLQ